MTQQTMKSVLLGAIGTGNEDWALEVCWHLGSVPDAEIILDLLTQLQKRMVEFWYIYKIWMSNTTAWMTGSI